MARKPVSYLAGSVILGTAIGAVVGLLAAPRSGEALRKNLVQRALDAKERVGAAGREIPKQISALPGRGMEQLGRMPEAFKRGRSIKSPQADSPTTQVTVEGEHAPPGPEETKQ